MGDDSISDAREWLAFANEDLSVAEHLYETYHPLPLEIVCFHCQQAAEKAVKSIIVLNGSQGGIPKKHDLYILLNQIRNMVDIDEKYYDYADILTPYSVVMRYPNELFLEERHAKNAVDMAKEYVNWAKEMINNAEKDIL